MKQEKEKLVKLELKYCEGCGALKLRADKSPYCLTCERRMGDHAERGRYNLGRRS